MRIILSGGGTGGHIYPAIAIAEALKKIDEKNEILFIGAKGKLEEKIVPEYGYEIKTISISGFSRKNLLMNVSLPYKLLKSIYDCRKYILGFKPDIVVGTGGYVCFPVLKSAQRLKIKNIIQEGNAFPGKTVKALSVKANKVIINFNDSEKYFVRKDNLVRISHPIRMNLNLSSKSEALKSFGFDEKNKTIFIFGGSQGARGINEVILNNLEKLTEFNLLWQTGKYDFQSIKEKVIGKSNIRIFDFIQDIAKCYSASDLVISRSGVTTIMELAALRIPAILVPYPFATENHQEFNARCLEIENAGKMILQNELKDKLIRTIQNIIYNNSELEDMKRNLEKFSDRDAAVKIANLIYETVN
ncbi:MAG TPA: undecaprenyldiphospho-muramoylpentapeptide beta-N-acetylglucosaminyltransferase [Ignavibacteria bacterium]|nr:undecaprenyldiphospho-muramoylpentapeptide beta-N-acetylglucosaminyltransferase [Ignavibacteria bacterium]